MPAAAIAATVTLRARLIRCWVAFESRHRRLVDDLTAALVAIVAIVAWYAAFALFAE